jgi:hypothetical protein
VHRNNETFNEDKPLRPIGVLPKIGLCNCQLVPLRIRGHVGPRAVSLSLVAENAIHSRPGVCPAVLATATERGRKPRGM